MEKRWPKKEIKVRFFTLLHCTARERYAKRKERQKEQKGLVYNSTMGTRVLLFRPSSKSRILRHRRSNKSYQFCRFASAKTFDLCLYFFLWLRFLALNSVANVVSGTRKQRGLFNCKLIDYFLYICEYVWKVIVIRSGRGKESCTDDNHGDGRIKKTFDNKSFYRKFSCDTEAVWVVR